MARTENFSLFWSTRRKKLVVALVVALMCLALVLRLLGGAISDTLYPIALAAVSIVTVLIVPTIAVFSIGALLVVFRRGVDRYGWFLPRKRTETMIPSVDGSSSDILLINGWDDKGYAISMLRLLSVPSQGVRQRVRGAVSRDEQEGGAAVSDEKQYQFSHLTSLLKSAGPGEGISYEVGFRRGIVSVRFTVSAEDSSECARKREQVKASLLSKFPVEVTEERGERLKEAALIGFLGKDAGGNGSKGDFHAEAVSERAALVLGWGSSRYVGVVALVGRPEMSANEQRSQIDQLITAVNKVTGNGHDDNREVERSGEKEICMSFIVSFRPSTPPRYPSDASLREKLRKKPDVKASLSQKRVEVDAMEVEFGHRVGWWRVSTYAVVIGKDKALVESRVESVASILRSVWSGSHFSPSCFFLSSKEVVGSFGAILRRSLLPGRYVTEMSSMRLSSLVHLPEEAHATLSRVTPPLFEAPQPDGDLENGGQSTIRIGEVLGAGVALYSLRLPFDVLGTHMVVFGETGSGKSCFTINMLVELLSERGRGLVRGVPFLVLDQKGEYRCLLSCPGASIVYFRPISDVAPLWINLFDAQGDDPDTHAKYIFNILREILFANRTELTPQMERVLYDVLRMTVGGDWSKFSENLAEYLKVNGDELPSLGATVQGILNRVGSFTRPPLSHVFDCKKSNVSFSYLTQRNVIIDLSELRRQGTPEDVRLLANIIAKYVGTASLRRGVEYGRGLRHLFVVDDALDVVPEILGKKTTAEVGIIEHMAMLLRASGQGLVVVSQRPNVSENVIGNSAIKVFFRSVVDSREVAAWINLSEEQQNYLKVLPRQEAIVMTPLHPSAIRIKVPDIKSILIRKLTAQDIVRNNMMQYPLMYEMKMKSEEEESLDGAEKKLAQGKQGIRVANEGEGGSGHERAAVVVIGEGDGAASWEKEGVTRLSATHRVVWRKLRTYLAGGVAVDSDMVSKVLDVSHKAGHQIMLALKSAALVNVMKIPNYSYGEGFQYVYYSSAKGLFGSGVIGYVRERIHGDLTAREANTELSPKDVPSADMIVENKYPLVIHLISSNYNRLILKALEQKIRGAASQLSSKVSEGVRQGGGGVIVVTPWRSAAQELEGARLRGELGDNCLCVIPFNRQAVYQLADFVLNHITLETLLAGDKLGDVKEGKENCREMEGDAEVKKEKEEKKELDKEVLSSGTIQERVLAVVKELGGVEPSTVAKRLCVRLPRVSEAAKILKEEGLIKVAKNIPYVSSLKKANAVYYLDAGKQTALHDTVMNLIWKRNIELNGRSRDFSFEFGGKTWCTDGLLENSGGNFLLEAMSGEFTERVAEQLGAYSTQVGHMGIKGVVVVALDANYVGKIREEVTRRGISLGNGLLSTLRSRDEKLQFKNLLQEGKPVAYHRNQTA